MTLNDKFGQEVLDTIKKDELKPKPRWHFILKDGVVWTLGAICLVVGALAASVIFHLLKTDWHVRPLLEKNWGDMLLLSLPYFWVVLFALFIGLVYLNFKHTKKGYRYPLWLIALVTLSATLVLGAVFQLLGWGQLVDDALGRRMPFYEEVFNRRAEWWVNPEQGRLAGMVIGQNGLSEFVLLDPAQNEWLVRVIATDAEELNLLVAGRPVNLIGKIETEKVFVAEKILPPMAGRGFFERGGRALLEIPCGKERDACWQKIMEQHPAMFEKMREATASGTFKFKLPPLPREWRCE